MPATLTQNKPLNRLNQLQLYSNLKTNNKIPNKDKHVIIKPKTKIGNPKMQKKP